MRRGTLFVIIYSMKKILNILILLAVLGVVWYQFGDTILVRFFPCKNPIDYTLGTFDAKCGISEKYFLSALADAEAIWEKPFGRELFVYKDGAKDGNILKVNLVYDYRQDATEKLEDIGISVENNKASYENLKSKLTALKAEYEKAKSSFNARVKTFNERQDAYEADVKYWNDRGGASKAEYEKLERERSALKAESEKLKAEQNRINEMVEEINAMVVVLNRLIATLNLSVEKYNTTNETRGEAFEEGV